MSGYSNSRRSLSRDSITRSHLSRGAPTLTSWGRSHYRRSTSQVRAESHDDKQVRVADARGSWGCSDAKRAGALEPASQPRAFVAPRYRQEHRARGIIRKGAYLSFHVSPSSTKKFGSRVPPPVCPALRPHSCAGASCGRNVGEKIKD